jgi:transposase
MDIRLEEYEFYIRPNFTDMRKGATGLAYIVQNEMQLQPFDKAVFVFCGRSRKTIKAIVWDRNGWMEIIKRLECNQTFRWPTSTEEAARISVDQLAGLLKGNDVWRIFPTFLPQLVG